LFDTYANSERKKKIEPIFAPTLTNSFNDSVDKGILFLFAITFPFIHSVYFHFPSAIHETPWIYYLRRADLHTYVYMFLPNCRRIRAQYNIENLVCSIGCVVVVAIVARAPEDPRCKGTSLRSTLLIGGDAVLLPQFLLLFKMFIGSKRHFTLFF
jgi:hypothetical protein